MPLRPLHRLTGLPKTDAELSDAEVEHISKEVIDEQKTNKMLNRPMDLTALDKADVLAKARKLTAVRQRIADARLALGAK
jgi:hypothetical protein